ncbi:MAG: TRAP transporter small permease subunit [Acetobacteraceae bacterium]|nr:TRAP transporter small permease subunit [Acetobacteraceae bacterium]
MRLALGAVAVIDGISRAFGWLASFAVLAACLISAAVASARYGLGIGSNAWLEIQWYLFGAMILLGGAWTLRRNEHVRVDLLYLAASPRLRLWIDLFGLVFFLMPGMLLLATLSWSPFAESFLRHEISESPGGLVRWPVKLLLPVGFALLALQGVAEIIRRIAALRGAGALDAEYVRPEQ